MLIESGRESSDLIDWTCFHFHSICDNDILWFFFYLLWNSTKSLY